MEDVDEFGGFGDFMCSFNLLRGKKTEDEDDEDRRFSGRFKVSKKCKVKSENRRYHIKEKTNAFWLGALRRDNQFVIFTT